MKLSTATIVLLVLVHLPLCSLAENISITLKDNTTINGELSNSEAVAKAALLLHQCNRDQTMWHPLVDQLVEREFSVLTVDMRGYGKSASAEFDIRKHNYNEVTRHFKEDIDQINEFWRQATPDSLQRVVVGASCGGGQATKIAAMDEDISALVLFSPSLREHWVDNSYVARLADRKNLPVLGIASEGDENSLKAVRSVFAQNASRHSQITIYKGDLHGEPLFAHDPKLAVYIADWIGRVVR